MAFQVEDEYGTPWYVAKHDPAYEAVQKLRKAGHTLIFLPRATILDGTLVDHWFVPESEEARAGLLKCMESCMVDPHRLVEIKLRPYEWEVIVASVLYTIKKLKTDTDMQPLLFGVLRMLTLVDSMEHQIACEVEETRDGQ